MSSELGIYHQWKIVLKKERLFAKQNFLTPVLMPEVPRFRENHGYPVPVAFLYAFRIPQASARLDYSIHAQLDCQGMDFPGVRHIGRIRVSKVRFGGSDIFSK